jgi:hypothetical protein
MWDLDNFLPDWSQTIILLISASQVAEITSVDQYIPTWRKLVDELMS